MLPLDAHTQYPTGFGAAKLTLKAKAAGNVSFKVEESRKFADGSVSASVEIKHPCPLGTGLSFKETYDTKSLTTEVSNENKLFHGHKFVAAYTCIGANGYKLKHEYVTDKFTSDSVFDGKAITASAVASVGKYNVGATASFDVAKSALKSHAVAASFTEGDFTANFSLANTTDVAFSVLHSAKNDTTAVDVTYKTKTGDNTFAVVNKHVIDADSFVKTSVDKNFQLGFGYTAKVASGVSLTLATQVDVQNLGADSHKVGLALTWE